MTTRGGFSCSFATCRNISGRSKDISFFRFPKDIERSKLWIKACGREDLINKTCEELHKNYRVCSLHFLQKMFLNDLRNRLQPNAVPIWEHNMLKRIDTCNEMPQFNCQKSLKVESDNLQDHLQSNTSNYVPNEEIQRQRENKETQTKLTLSRNSSERLKKKIRILQSKIYRLKKKKDTCTKNKIQTQESIEHYFKLTDNFLPAPFAKFVKTQVCLNQQMEKDKKYTTEFKEFCWRIYLSSSKCYDLLRETFNLPTKQTLQRIQGSKVSSI